MIEGSRRSIEIDLEAYMPLLEDVEISEHEKLELLQTLYAIIKSFIDLGFSVQSPAGRCGKLSPETSTALSAHVYSAYQKHTDKTEKTAGSKSEASEEGVRA